MLLLLLQNSAGREGVREGIGIAVALQEVGEIGVCVCLGSQHLLEIQTRSFGFAVDLALLYSAGMVHKRIPYFLWSRLDDSGQSAIKQIWT